MYVCVCLFYSLLFFSLFYSSILFSSLLCRVTLRDSCVTLLRDRNVTVAQRLGSCFARLFGRFLPVLSLPFCGIFAVFLVWIGVVVAIEVWKN
jgi:hypothetical protein